MNESNVKFSWIETHKELVKYLAKNQNNQKGLIDILQKAGITILNDKLADGSLVKLEEIEPFTFFCYVYKYGVEKDWNFFKILQKK